MNSEQVEALRQRLLAERQQLLDLQAAGVEAGATVQLDQTSVGRLTRMDALQGQAMAQERNRRRELTLRGIAAALRRIDSGDYGYCERCGEPINPARLDLEPAAALCITCAAIDEQ